MAVTIDDLNTALAGLQQAEKDLEARVAALPTSPDLTNAVATVNAVASALNAVAPAPVPTPAPTV